MIASRLSRPSLVLLTAVLVALTFVACGDDGSSEATATPGADDYRKRLVQIGEAVANWQNATTIEEAHASAEAAANLVVGPAGPSYGDRDGNGTIEGATEIALLPALAAPLDANACVVADVLGGAWDDPEGRWNIMLTAIEDWRPDRNTMPSLPSHPMRIVGWGTFTLASDSLDDAHEYAGHAQLHVNVSLAALDC